MPALDIGLSGLLAAVTLGGGKSLFPGTEDGQRRTRKARALPRPY